ncbi:MAG: 2-C-methyl-D-erythritol 4-phosphate cytidylyltransferase [Lapillicoccus sp.]
MSVASGVAVVIVAAGSGARLGAGAPKAFVALDGVPLLTHAVSRAVACPLVTTVVVVAPATHLEQAQACLAAGVRDVDGVRVAVVEGGRERGHSVMAGLAAIGADVDVVLVHDAARALAPPALFARVIAAVRAGHPAVVPGVAVVDTIKQVDPEGTVTATPDRGGLRAIQTPQGFDRAVLERAHAEAADQATDDAGLVERLGIRVLVVPGELLAHKITTPADLGLAAWMLATDGVVT